jgi:hypothetical protein
MRLTVGELPGRLTASSVRCKARTALRPRRDLAIVAVGQISSGNAHVAGAVTAMKLFRYRKPSLKTVLGVTRAKKRLKKDLGITAAMKPLRWWTNQKRTAKRRIGYESSAGRLIRNGLPKPGGGCVVILLSGFIVARAAISWMFA